jgi:hypothetical protein
VQLVTPPTSTVLVLSSQPLVAALLGMLLDLLGYRPVFAADGERPEDALQRQHPLFGVLVDGDTEAAASDAFFARAAQGRVGLAFFGVRGRTPAHAPLARERGVPSFELPLDLQELSRAVEMAAASDWWRRRSERRATPHLEHADGGLVFVDPAGHRWSVYDRRRGVDRRAAGDSEVQRVFVNDAGEEWTYAMNGASVDVGTGADEPRVPSPAELQRQLEGAVRVERGD